MKNTENNIKLINNNFILLTNTKYLLYGDEDNIIGKAYSNGHTILYSKSDSRFNNSKKK